MELARRRLLLAVGAGLFMCLIVWLNVSEASPVYHVLAEEPEAGYGLLILNLPALFVSRLVSGTPPSLVVVYLACFIQWFVLGLVLSFALWRSAAKP